MKIPRRHLKVSRVLRKDDPEFATLEVGKTDQVVFTLGINEEGETVGGDEFLTVVFLRSDGMGGMQTWDPFE